MKRAQVWAPVVVGLLAIVCLLLLGPAEAAEQTSGSDAASASGSTTASKSPGSSSPSQSKSSTPASSSRQDFKQYNRAMTKSLAGSLIGALGNMVPGLITNVAPLVLLFGIGALMMPALGLNAAGLLRDSRRR